MDSFGITLLSLDPLHPKGLQVQIDNEWVDVPFIENSFVLNVGAMLSRWTNGAWKAALHRVVFTPGQRLSIVSGALRPRDDVVLEPITQGLDEAKFPPITAGEFCRERVEMHKPEYLQKKKANSAKAVRKLSSKMQDYQLYAAPAVSDRALSKL